MTSKVALVVGGGTGIGRATALQFADRGYRVAISGRRSAVLAEVVNEIGERDALAIAGDVSVEEDRKRFLQLTVEEFGGVDTVVNAAGIVHAGPLTDVDPAHIEEMVRVNLLAPILLYKEAVNTLALRQGNIVSIGSVGGVRSSRVGATYGAAKAGIHHLTACLAREFAPKRVRINTIVPGPVDTAFVAPEVIHKLAESTLVGRIGQPDDIARWVVAIADDTADWVTGSTFLIDGGFVIGP